MQLVRHILLLLLFLSLPGINSAYSQQDKKEDLYKYTLQKTLESLSRQSKSISGIKFDKVHGISAERREKLIHLQSEIVSNTNSLIYKLSLPKVISKTASEAAANKDARDVSKELEFYNDPKTMYATEYLLNYKENVKLIQSVFVTLDKRHSSVGGMEGQVKEITPFRSTSKIYDALTKDIYKALIEDLNTSDPESWDQTKFIITFGNSENFRQYIDKRCADIAILSDSTTKQLLGIENGMSNTGVLEDLYLMISGKNPDKFLDRGAVKVSELAFISSQHLTNSYLFGLETIKHNQLLYAPPVGDIFANDQKEAPKPKVQEPVVLKVQEPSMASSDALRVDGTTTTRMDYKKTETAPQPTPTPTPEISFEKKYSSFSVEKLITELNSKKDADYYTPYIKLLIIDETLIGDYASEVSKVSNTSQDDAYSIAEDAKTFSAGCELALAAGSFIATVGTVPVGAIAISSMIGLGAVDEVKMISREVEA